MNRPADAPPAGPSAEALAAWRALVDAQLKGADFERRLVTRTPDQIPIQPLYTEAPPGPTGLPGLAPFTRGATPKPGFDARVLHASPELAAEHRAILEDLAQGADSLCLRFGGPNRDGLALHRASDVARELEGVDLAQTPVELDPGPHGAAAAALYLAATGLTTTDLTRPLAPGGGFGVDPLGAVAAEGCSHDSLTGRLARAARLARFAHDRGLSDHFRALTIDTGPYHLAGATDAQELALALATGVEYLRALTTTGGLSPSAAAAQIALTLSVDAQHFQQIAKLRAARRLWHAVLDTCGATAPLRLQARPAQRMFSRNDPWVNLLRNTAACFAAIVGGAQVIYSLPFDHAVGRPDPMARRIARNTLSVLRHEAQLDAVADPAGGAYLVEQLTEALAVKAWAQFQAIEAAGGLAAALRSGRIHTELEASHQARRAAIATRKQALTGVSEFPNLKETPLERPPRVPIRPDAHQSPPGAAAALAALRASPPEAALEAAIAAAAAGATLGDLALGLAAADDRGAEGYIPPLPQRPDAAPYERLRAASEAWRAAHGDRPRIFLANLGPLARHTARAGWASNLLAAGGIEPIPTDGFADAATLAGAFAGSGARLACICGDDPSYAELAEAAARALKAAGAKQVVLAGRPDPQGALRAAGVDHFIHLGCDVLATLEQILTAEGVLS